MDKIIMDFLNDTAAAHANENIVITTGCYDDYYGEILDVQVKSISALWRSLEAQVSVADLHWKCLCYRANSRKICYSPYAEVETSNECSPAYKLKGTTYRPLRDLPPSESHEALKILMRFIDALFSEEEIPNPWEEFRGKYEDGCYRLELERDVVERERKERFDALQSLAASVLKDTGGENLFEVLAARVRDAEAYVEGLHEDGLCAVNPFSSSAVDDWCDLRNAAQGRVASEEELFYFCISEYPLSYLAWQEAKLQEAKLHP